MRVERTSEDGAVTVWLEGDGAPVRVGRLAGSLLVSRERRTCEAAVFRRPGEIVVEIMDARFVFAMRSTGSAARVAGPPGRAEVRSPMPGKVVRIMRGNGDRVKEGEGVLVYEAMKMQNEIRAPASGVLGKMSIAEGSPLEGRELLFVVEPS